MANQKNKLIPDKTGIGLRSEHYQSLLETLPNLGWLEIHSENYFSEGGLPLQYLDKICNHYLLSLHGVGLSIGSADPLDFTHLQKTRNLINRFKPILVSEHLCWGAINKQHLNDLLPLPYTEESLKLIIDKVNQVQEFLQRSIMLENISTYLEFTHSTIPEYEFLTSVANNTGCEILLDINNLYVNQQNHGWDLTKYLHAIPKNKIKEIHLAGFTENKFAAGTILIDTHNKPVHHAVWELYQYAIVHFGNIPTLIEWDANLPPLNVLVQEAHKADAILEKTHACVA